MLQLQHFMYNTVVSLDLSSEMAVFGSGLYHDKKHRKKHIAPFICNH